jgi:hypothetical protein
MGLPLREGLGTGAQILSLRLQLSQSLEVLALLSVRVFGLETELDLLLADERLQVLRDPLTEPVNSGLGMLPGRGIERAMCTTRLYHSGSLSALIYLDFFADQPLRGLMVPRRGGATSSNFRDLAIGG